MLSVKIGIGWVAGTFFALALIGGGLGLNFNGVICKVRIDAICTCRES
jgi:hypothetical protein